MAVSSLNAQRGPSRFAFLEAVTAVSADPSDARGGGRVTVAGAGFDPAAGPDYACIFSASVPGDGVASGGDGGGAYGEMASASVAAASAALVVCEVPDWGAERAAGRVAVALRRGGGRGVLLPLAGPPFPVEIELVETWSAAALEGVPLNATGTAFGARHTLSPRRPSPPPTHPFPPGARRAFAHATNGTGTAFGARRAITLSPTHESTGRYAHGRTGSIEPTPPPSLLPPSRLRPRAY